MSPFDPALSLEAVREIDAVCDRFEEALQSGDPPPLETFLEAVSDERREALLLALLEVELEYRRAWGEQPSADEYLTRFAGHQDAVRAAFQEGDPFGLVSGKGHLLRLALARATGRRADRLRIYYQGELVHTALLTGPLELGRQQQGESPPFATIPGPVGQRLIVAPLEETTVSRRHAILTPEGADHVRIANLSTINPIFFSRGGRLACGATESFPLTLEMTLGAVFVCIDRPIDQFEAPQASEFADRECKEAPCPSQPRKGLLQRLWRRGR